MKEKGKWIVVIKNVCKRTIGKLGIITGKTYTPSSSLFYEVELEGFINTDSNNKWIVTRDEFRYIT